MKQPVLNHYVRTFRKRCGLTQCDIAALLGYKDGSQVSRFENGEITWRFDTAIALAFILSVDLNELYEGKIALIQNQIKKNAIKRLRELGRASPNESLLTDRRMQALRMLAQDNLLTNIYEDKKTESNC